MSDAKSELVFTPYDPTPTCGAHRKHTSARCELIPNHWTYVAKYHDGWHFGRDKQGRWHSWKAIA